MSMRGYRIYEYDLPLASPLALPLCTLTSRSGMLVRLESDTGRTGWGDIAPLPGFSRETYEQAREQVTTDVPAMLMRASGAGAADVFPSVAFGIESAQLMLASEEEGLGVAQYLRRDAEGSVQVCPLLDGRSGDVVSRAVALREQGATVVKVKVGALDPTEDARIVRAIADALGAGSALRVDANRRWTLGQAETFMSLTSCLRLEYLEEPLSGRNELLAFAERTGCALALDETLAERSISKGDPLLAHVRAFVLKPTVLGGWSRMKTLIRLAATAGIQRVISACFESGIGHWHLASLAAALPGTGPAAGLDTASRLAGDVINPAFSALKCPIVIDAPFSERHQVDMDRCRLICEGDVPVQEQPSGA